MPEVNVVSVVEEVCAQPSFGPELVFKLRSAVQYVEAERKVLQTRDSRLAGEELPPEEKALRQAVFAWCLGRAEQAEAALRNLEHPLAALVQGELALDRKEYDRALELLKGAAQQLRSPQVELEVAGALRAADKLSEAEAQLGTLEGQGLASSAEFLFQKGRLKERQGSQEEACALYEQALDREPQHAEAAFRLAYFLDLRGQNARAIELYRRVTAQSPSFVTALVNLGLLLEDHDDVDGAIQCFKEALRSDPTNRRAALHLRDAIKSLDMFYDETERKESERLESVLRLPVADFELSVRSRNCLAKMNVKTLGDLVRRTEHELLAFKNFGETSLSEIRNLLSARGLRLGMFREEEAKRARAVRMRLPGPESTALNKSISDLELSIRARRCMQKLNVESLSELVEKSEAELLAIKNFGQTSLNEIKAKLGELGLSLRPGE